MSTSSSGLEEEDWAQLLERIKNKKCTPIVGSGAVKGGPPVGVPKEEWTFEYPLGEKLAEAWSNEFKYPLADCNRLERVAQFMAVEGDLSRPKERVARALCQTSPPNFRLPNEPHRILAELELPVYLTTNADDYLIRALRAAEKDVRVSLCRWNKHISQFAPAYDPNPAKRDLVPFASADPGDEEGKLSYNLLPDARYKPSPASPLVYHFHGHMEWPSSIVVSEDDYFEFLLNLAKTSPSIIMPRIEQVFGEGTLLFLGYQLSDWDFLVLFRLLSDSLQGGFKHVAVQLGPMTSSTEADATKAAKAAHYLATYFEARNIKVYWGTCQEFVAELKGRLA